MTQQVHWVIKRLLGRRLSQTRVSH